jgi:hypothetical protein
MSGHRITETGGSRYAMPTPVVAMEAPNKRSNSKGPKNLVEIAQGKWDHFWPTPRALEINESYDGYIQRMKKNGNPKNIGKTKPQNLTMAVNMWPTPTAHNAKETNAPSESNRNTPTLSAQAGGKLNPMWVEWLMGWPLGWTNLKQSGMVKSRFKSQQRLPSWLRSK